MPELPEVETLRRLLEAHVIGRTIRAVRLSGQKLREPVSPQLSRRLKGRRFLGARRHGKYLLLDLDGGRTLVSHLGMSGRWLFQARPPGEDMPHVHARFHFMDGSQLWFQDTRRFGLLHLAPTSRLSQDRHLVDLGPDPVSNPLSGIALSLMAKSSRLSVKAFLLDQKRVAGIGNIYASEILHRAGVDPRVRAGRLNAGLWEAIAREIGFVLLEAIERSGTTFDMYRTLWNEPGGYGDQLRVYDRSGAPCRRCGTAIRRIVQGARSTFFCPGCQTAGGPGTRKRVPSPAPSRDLARPGAVRRSSPPAEDKS